MANDQFSERMLTFLGIPRSSCHLSIFLRGEGLDSQLSVSSREDEQMKGTLSC